MKIFTSNVGKRNKTNWTQIVLNASASIFISSRTHQNTHLLSTLLHSACPSQESITSQIYFPSPPFLHWSFILNTHFTILFMAVITVLLLMACVTFSLRLSRFQRPWPFFSALSSHFSSRAWSLQ